MSNHSPYSIVLTYDETTPQLFITPIEREKIAPMLAQRFQVPFLIQGEPLVFDDEFGRQLGAAILNAIALGQPDIDQFISFTQHPLDRPEN